MSSLVVTARRRMTLISAMAAVVLAACAQAPVNDEDILYSSGWFACKSRFNCVVVYDSFCNLTAVNSRYSIVYQDWSRQEVIRLEERTVCPRPDRLNEVGGCVQGRCVYPFNLRDFSGTSP